MQEDYNLVVIGQGYVGLPLSINAAKSGFNVYGFDIDKKKISNLWSGFTESPEVTQEELITLQDRGKIKFSHETPNLTSPVIVVIAVPTPLDNNHEPDLRMLKSACKLVSKFIVDGSLVINESTSYIGTLRDLVRQIINSESGLKHLDYAVAPERIDPGNSNWNMRSTPRVVSGLDDSSSKRVLDFYSKFCDQVHLVSSPEVAEAAKLFENTFRQINIALVNELSEIAVKLNFSTHEAINAAATKPYGFMPFYPSIGVGGHCIPIDPSYLKFSADSVGVTSNFITLANEVNLSAVDKVVERIQKEISGKIRGKKIQVVGISYKPNISDVRESPALVLLKILGELGGIVSWHDPLVGKWQDQVSAPLASDIDLGLIVTPHDQIDFSPWEKSNLKVLDLSASSKYFGWPKFL